MYSKIYTSDKKEFRLLVTITCSGKKEFRVWAEVYGKRNSKYSDRNIFVEGKRTIELKFPYWKDQIFIGVANAQSPTDKEFQVELIEADLQTYNIDMNGQTKRFVKFAQQFTIQCGYTNVERSLMFFSPDKEFKIRYADFVRNPMDGQIMNTPAAIGHNTGIINISKVKFDKYTIAMRMMIILHEYSHKYRNPKIGLEIENEIGADINALYIYLGLGYSKVDAICVFANVFLKAQTPSNIQRMRKIMDYIVRFENKEYAQLN